MSKNTKRYLLVILGFMITGTGAAITMKANVGVGAWDALAKSTNDLTGIAVGTAGMFFNCSCVIGQICILRKNFKLIQFLQIPLSILLGTIINFVLYYLLVFPFDSFIGGCFLYLLGSTFAALGVSLVMLLDEVTFALEGFCMALTKVIPFKFASIRQAVDVICIILIIIAKFALNLPWSIGVGTIIGMLTFGPMLGIFMKLFKPVLKKRNLLNYE